jgi:hypothetical protein
MNNSESQKTTASTSAMQSPWDFWEQDLDQDFSGTKVTLSFIVDNKSR